MVARPRSRARRIAKAIAEGREPEVWIDDRPTKKPIDRNRNTYAMARTPATRMPTTSLPAEDAMVTQITSMMSGLKDGPVDEETNKRFERLRQLAFDHAIEIMEIKLDPENRNFAKIASLKTAISQSVLTATTRVRPGDLREKDEDGVDALLEQVKRQGRDGAAQEIAGKDAGSQPAQVPVAGVSEPTLADLLS